MAVKSFEPKTEFNAAVASLMRLNDLLILCNEFRLLTTGYNIQSLKIWQSILEAIYSELYPKIAPNKHNLKIMNGLFKMYKKVGNLITYNKIEDETTSTLEVKNFHKYYQINDAIEKNLRLIADKKGMLIPDEADMFGR